MEVSNQFKAPAPLLPGIHWLHGNYLIFFLICTHLIILNLVTSVYFLCDLPPNT